MTALFIGWSVPGCVYATGIAYRKRIGFREATYEDETYALLWACIWSLVALVFVAVQAVAALRAKWRNKPAAPDSISQDVRGKRS